jgi:hypothetical protein
MSVSKAGAYPKVRTPFVAPKHSSLLIHRISYKMSLILTPGKNNGLRFRDLEIGIPVIVEPLLRGGHQGGLAVAVGHGVIGVPSRQVVVEGAGVDNPV